MRHGSTGVGTVARLETLPTALTDAVEIHMIRAYKCGTV
jgi:hypothetical protein